MTKFFDLNIATLLNVPKRAIRVIFYRFGLYQLLMPQARNADQNRNAVPSFWDEKLAGEWASYLGGTPNISLRNSIVRSLIIQHHCAKRASLLDVGCADGSLGYEAGMDIDHYVGVDISTLAIKKARQKAPGLEFHVSSLQDFQYEGVVTITAFNEVLYYLSPEEALTEVHRINQNLSDDGIMIVSMKKDSKSELIFRHLARRYTWVAGVLHQRKMNGPSFRITMDVKAPGFLTAVFRKSS